MNVFLEDIAQAFEEMDANWKPYLHKKSGEIIFVPQTEEAFNEVDEEEKNLYYEIDALSDYIVLPDQKELREFDIMEQYTDDLANVGMQQRLYNALRKPKPFRNFRAQIRLLNLEEDYGYYRYMIFNAKARLWCIANGIQYSIDTDEVKDYIAQIEKDEKLEKELEDFDDSLDEFEYEEDYEDYFE